MDRGETLEWNEFVLEVLGKALPLVHTHITPADTEQLLGALLTHVNARADVHSRSLKFCALLTTMVPLVGGIVTTQAHATRFAQPLLSTLGRTNTYLTKPAVSKLRAAVSAFAL